MSDEHTNDDHMNRVYAFQIGERGEWAEGIAWKPHAELKTSLRQQLRNLLDGISGPWEYDLDELSETYRIESLHAIPEKVHRELLQGWLDRINRKRGPLEQLFLAAQVVYCCYWASPSSWEACVDSELLSGADAKSAQPLLIEATAVEAKIKRKIPVHVGAAWTCELTHDGRREQSGTRSSRTSR